ncbi:DNA repair protein RecN [Lapillicoccus jejuensis]|uniref:DNA repair protein RecN n=1 Tax=Lapillicoccus jejuensis TaxID=402171 RepID=A0A542E6L2_9MICO|nr:DNA repair protein RecN [Lapillicoccus jejuensis]TQJ10973.1 DNA replication and repair protein RecN [Lapillicoccus jejuensis]
MFQQIRLRGLGVIDDAVLDLSPGLNVLTGETGAGKTMVVSGLGLLLGARADAGLVRAGSDTALVEGLVELPPGHPALVRAAEAGADTDGELVLARTVSREGRSRAHVGGRSAPVGVLAELGEQLVAVHGQADQWRLRQGDQHRQVLDDAGGPALRTAREEYTAAYDALTEAVAERDRLRRLARERAREVDALRAGLDRIEALDPQPGEDLALRAEDERLGHADTLRLAAEQAHGLLTGEGDGFSDAAAGVLELLATARSALAPVQEHDPELAGLEKRLAEVAYLAADLSTDLASYGASVDVDPGRLAQVQQRRADLAALTRAYGDTVDEVLAWAREAAASLEEILGADDRVEALEARTAELRAGLGERAARLRAARLAAARDFAGRVTTELGHLAMGKARVEVAVTTAPPPDGDEGLLVDGERVRAWRHGVDEVEILLAANAGAPARSVARAASGGELSRVMLALEVVTATAGGGAASVPTFVFDEVDAGVGGRAAIDVGARLAALARGAQVVVVTHLAQVAAFADRHLVVRKDDDGRVTASSVALVEDEERLAELSRMMGGDPGSAAGLAHARELVAQAAAARTGGDAPRRGRARARRTMAR